MIQDTFVMGSRYAALNPGLARAFEFLARPGVDALPEGRHEVDGQRVWAVVARGQGRDRGEARLEVHDRHIDVQCILAGVDRMGWKPREACRRPAGPFDAGRDVGFFDDDPDAWLDTRAGQFAILFPHDAHMPMISAGAIHKIIFKVAVDQG
ncbi:YhcH/YjgK/YiaL family protein [Desulfocurvus sp.]|jgi:YhcH/YjgK/YiaL family protein|uniref:YhcH/YjgK/YiaL family protein n=1 Tax=Desulfocurvus sp. TaxID=2871698 RepID=UPI0025BC7D2D|nr:YhcH/YjgK/YiaL family protein [Desulfocurvus sp.]MCK9240770.1 YhcH/YjgK/YiaL family protein [Desulfocurvus sp.]